ncbi:MAG: PAS domain-containing protein [Muribaculaceae bacterium]|nr:PAS domain-containing protein [Muribaculaceae bacterium]
MKTGLRSGRGYLMAVIAALIIGASVWLIILAGDAGKKSFFIAQGILAASLVLLWVFYMQVIKPLNTLATGMNLLREQDFSSRLRRVGQDDADKIVEMFNHMIKRLKDEQLHVREQNHFLDLLVESSPMGIIVLDYDNRILSANSAAASILDCRRDALPGRPLHSFDGRLPQTLAALRDREVRTLRLSNAMLVRCSRHSYMDSGFSHPFLLMERLTDEVMQAEREAYEKVIRMMAHEVNNSVAALTSMLDILGYGCPDPATTEIIGACIQRCTHMSNFITSFANVVKTPAATLSNTELDTFLTESRTVLESLCAGRDIRLEILPSGKQPVVKMDSVLMEQVLINLVKNAVESIGSGGQIRVRCSDRPTRIVVEDNGRGITDDVAQNLFSPFFSTKTDGQGLGLLLVRDILRAHNCRYSLATGADGITRFTIEFP